MNKSFHNKILLFTFILLTSLHIHCQKATYQIHAELIPDNNVVKVQIGIEVPVLNYISEGTLSILFLQNALKNRSSAFHKTWLNSFGPELYFNKSIEKKGFHNLKVMVDGQNVPILYHDASEILGRIKLPAPDQKEKNINLEIQYELFVTDENQIYLLRDWYPIVLTDKEQKTWEKGQFTSFSFIPSHAINYDLTIKSPANYELVINETPVKTEKTNSYSTSHVTGMSEDISVVAVPDTKQIKKGTVRYFGEKVPFTYITLTSEDYDLVTIENELQKIFGYFETYVGPFPQKELFFCERESKVPLLLTGSNYIDLNNPATPGFYKYLVKQIGSVWLGNKVQQDDFTEDWYMDGLIEYFTEKYFRLTDINAEDEYPMAFNPSNDFEPTELWLDNYKLNYLRKNKALKDNTSGTGCFQHQYKYISVASYLAYMEMILGEDIFANTLKSYLEDTKADKTEFSNLVEYVSQKTGTNFITTANLLETEAVRMDYSIESVAYSDANLEIKIQNRGRHPLDFPIVIADIGGKESVQKIDGFTGTKSFNVPIKFREDSIKIVSIDPYGMLPDQNRENNHYFFDKRNPRSAPLKLRFAGQNNSFTKDLYLCPVPMFNDNDKFMAGVIISNTDENIRNFRWSVIPAYSFSNKKWVGQARMSYDIIRDESNIERIRLTGSFKSYDFNRSNNFNYSQRYIKFDPSVSLIFRSTTPGCNKASQLRYRFVYLREQYPVFRDGNFEKLAPENPVIHRIEYEKSGGGVLAPYRLNSNIEFQSYTGGFSNENQRYLKITAAFEQGIMYDANKSFHIRLFGSAFLMNTQRDVNSYANNLVRGSIALIHQGFNDYLYDEYFASRQNQGGSFSSQVSLENGGGFKTAVGSAYSIGMSNNMAFAVNMSADLPFNLPFNLPLKPYFDFGIYSVPTREGKMEMRNMWNGGLMINFENLLSIHFPLVYSTELKNTVLSERGGFLNQISFMINLNKIAPNF